MPYGEHSNHRPATRQRLVWTLCAGMAAAALPGPFAGDLAPASVACAQQPDRATQALFLAVDKNDLPGVQAAIEGGADIEARDFNGMQAVDLAIERGYFDIAHYLITIRNRQQAKAGETAKPAPSPEQLAETQRQIAQEPAAPAAPPAPELPAGKVSPFDAPRVADGLPVIGKVREPESAPAQPTQVAQAQPQSPAQPLAPQKPSAAKQFFTTFLDFFKPPNTTGIVRRKDGADGKPADALTDEELSKELQQLEQEQKQLIKGPEVPISPEELARELPPAPEVPEGVGAATGPPFETTELPPYQVQPPGAPAPERPKVSSAEAFGELQVEEVTAADEQPPAPAEGSVESMQTVLDTNLPFDGGVDPDILNLLGMGTKQEAPEAPQEIAQADPFAAPEEDPFAAPPGETDTVAGVLEGLGDAQEVAPLEAQKPPSRAESDALPDPFAVPDQPSAQAEEPFAAPPPGEVDELAGLLEGIGEEVSSKPDGWDVKKVDGAELPSEMPLLASVEPTGQVLDGVELALGADTVIGQAVGEDRLKMLDQETIHKPCLQKGGPETVFCVDKVNWAFELEEDFLVDTIMYQGTRAIARYDAGRASYYHVLFKTDSFAKIVKHYMQRFGPPSEKVERAIAPLAQPRRDNPTYIWRSREPGTDTVITLEIRQFDDARGGFPDTKRGVILLYREHAGEIFPLLSQLELMVLKDAGAMDLAPKTPDSVW